MWKKWKKGESVLEQLVISFSLPQPRVSASLGVCVLSFTLHFFLYLHLSFSWPPFPFLLPSSCLHCLILNIPCPVLM